MALRVRLASGGEDLFEVRTCAQYWSRPPNDVKHWIAVDYTYATDLNAGLTVTRHEFGYMEHDSPLTGDREYTQTSITSEHVRLYRSNEWKSVRKD